MASKGRSSIQNYAVALIVQFVFNYRDYQHSLVPMG
jgi:hypothetical protein